MSDLLNEFNIFSKISDNLKKIIKYFHVFNDGKSVLFVTIDDKVYGFGLNLCGMLGLGHNEDVNSECEIIELTNQRIIQFHIGYSFVIALSVNNKLFAWGRNDFGQLGRGYVNYKIAKPLSIAMFDNVKIKQIHLCIDTIAILTDDRKVYVWGNNKYKQCDNQNVFVSKPIEKIFPKGVIIESIFVFLGNSFAICKDGNVYIWGEKSYRQKFVFGSASKARLINSIGNVKYIAFDNLKTFFLLNDQKLYVTEKFDRFDELKYAGHTCIFDKIITCKSAFSKIKNYYLIDNNSAVYEILSNNKLNLVEKSIFDFFANKHVTLETIELKIIINKKGDIGHGGFGKVFKSVRYGREYAIKKIDMFRLNKDLMDKNSEISIMWKLSSEYIANLYDYWIEMKDDDEFLYMEMELCDCNLKDFFIQITECKNLPDEIIITIEIEVLKQMFESVNYLHQNKVIYRDLKPYNILIKFNSSNGRFIKLCDFGLSVNHEWSSMSHTSDVGTGVYIAPEVKQGGKYTEMADIYSLGVMIYKDFKLLSIMEGNFHEYLKEIETFEKLFLEEDPNKRPNWNTILDVFKTLNFTKFIGISRTIVQNFIRNESNNLPVDILKILNSIHKEVKS